MEYTFTLKYQLAADYRESDAIVGQLNEAGCKDALVGIGLPGRLALAFTREAASAEAAVCSALGDVRRAVSSAKLIEAAPDLVGLTDAARVVGLSRRSLRKLMMLYPGSFPAPIHEGSASIWHLADILSWIQSRGNYGLPPEVLEMAEMAMQVNVAKETRRLPPPSTTDLAALIG